MVIGALAINKTHPNRPKMCSQFGLNFCDVIVSENRNIFGNGEKIKLYCVPHRGPSIGQDMLRVRVWAELPDVRIKIAQICPKSRLSLKAMFQNTAKSGQIFRPIFHQDL